MAEFSIKEITDKDYRPKRQRQRRHPPFCPITDVERVGIMTVAYPGLNNRQLETLVRLKGSTEWAILRGRKVDPRNRETLTNLRRAGRRKRR